jgi:TonB family protein
MSNVRKGRYEARDMRSAALKYLTLAALICARSAPPEVAAASSPSADHPAQTGGPALQSPPVEVDALACSYPPVAMRMNLQGSTVVTVDVSPAGIVSDAVTKVSSGYPALDKGGIACARAQKFQPATQNGTPVESHTDIKFSWALATGDCASAGAVLSPPPGWTSDKNNSCFGGITASFQLEGTSGNDTQYLSVAIYGPFATLPEFITRNDESLHGDNTFHLLKETNVTVCAGQPGSEIEYKKSISLSAFSNSELDVDQIRQVNAGSAYVSTYIRPLGAPARADAEKWILQYCASKP